VEARRPRSRAVSPDDLRQILKRLPRNIGVLLLRSWTGWNLAEIARHGLYRWELLKSRLHNALGTLARGPRTKQFLSEPFRN